MYKLVLLTLTLGACTSEEVTTTIEGHRVPCFGFAQGSCLSAHDEDGATRTIDQGIEGFKFVWGQRQRVTYSVHELPESEVLQDGSSIEYRLVSAEVEDVYDSTDSFYLTFAPSEPPFAHEPWFTAKGSDRVVFSGDEIACEPALCAELVAKRDAFVVTFRHGAPAPAVATAIAVQ